MKKITQEYKIVLEDGTETTIGILNEPAFKTKFYFDKTIYHRTQTEIEDDRNVETVDRSVEYKLHNDKLGYMENEGEFFHLMRKVENPVFSAIRTPTNYELQ